MSAPMLSRQALGLCRRYGGFVACESSKRPLVASRFSGAMRMYASQQQKSSGKDEGKRDFEGQMWESTKNRVQKEREEQEHFASRRQVGGRGETVGYVIGFLMASGFAYWLGTMKNPAPSDTSTLPLSAASVPKHDTSTGNMQAAWTDLKNIVGNEYISTDQEDRESHAGSAWSTYAMAPGDVPFCVVRPASTEEVSSIMKICHKRRIPVTAYSGGTSLEGHFAATRGGICIDFSRMDQIIAIHENDLDVVVQPALAWEALNDELSEYDLFFPPDPGPGAMIGGMVGTGCSGTNAYRFGTMRSWVHSLTVVMADGTIVKTRQRPPKSSAGYDLTRLFIGSEGTLGLVTEATLKVTAAPKNPRVAAATFETVHDATECVHRIVRRGIPINAVELLDDQQMKFLNDAGATSRKWTEAPTLFFKFAGNTTKAVEETITTVKGVANEVGSKSFEFAQDEDEAAELWSARKEALWSTMAKKKKESDHVWTTDVAVPLSHLPTIVDETKKDITESGLIASIVGHVGDGNFHAIILYGDEERETAEECVHRMVKRAIELEGTATGEHGVGLVKRDYLEHELNRDTVDAMRAIKKAWDPLCLLNCDKIVRVQQPKKGEVPEW